ERALAAWFAGRGPGRARRRPRVPAQRRSVHRGSDPHLDRVQAQARGGRSAPAAASLRVSAVLRHLGRRGVSSAKRPAGIIPLGRFFLLLTRNRGWEKLAHMHTPRAWRIWTGLSFLLTVSLCGQTI